MAFGVLIALVFLLVFSVNSLRALGALNQGLVSCWTMDNSDKQDTTIIDVAGANNGFYEGPVVEGILGESLDPGGHYAVVSDSDSLDKALKEGTVIVWLTDYNGAGERSIIEDGDTNENTETAFSLYTLDGQPFLAVQDGKNSARVGAKERIPLKRKTIPLSNDLTFWTMVGASWDSKSATVFVNGKPNAMERINTLDLQESNNADLTIGGFKKGPWDGQIDQVAVWNRKLGANEIRRYYNNGKGISCKDNQFSTISGILSLFPK